MSDVTQIIFKRSTTNTPTTLPFGQPAWKSTGAGVGTLYVGDSTGQAVAVTGGASSGFTTAGPGLQADGVIVQIRSDTTSGDNNFPVTATNNGASIRIDNVSLVSDADGKLIVGVVDGGEF